MSGLLNTLAKYGIYLSISLCYLALPLGAWDRGTAAYDKPTGVTVEPLMPHDSTHLLPQCTGGPELALSIRNIRPEPIQGAFLYLGITDFTGRGIQDFDRRIDLPANSETILRLKADFLEHKPDFYDVRALLFDSGRELAYKEFSFGYDATHLPVEPSRPADFQSFWKAALDSLKEVPLSATVLRDTVQSGAMCDVYRVSYQSLHRVRVHGWFTVPRWKAGPYAALLFFPGYSSGRILARTDYSKLGYATLSIQVRGYGVDQESYPEDNSRYMTIGIESPQTYIYREIVCHCLRAVDFAAQRPEVDRRRIGTVGGSQGGGLALLVAGLDPRIKVASANVPFLTDFPRSLTMTGNPYRDVLRYIESNPEKREKVMRTVSYFDVLNLAQEIKTPVIVSTGLFDRTCPAPSIYGMFLCLAAREKKIMIYPYLDHLEVQQYFSRAEKDWIMEHLPPLVESK